MQLIRSGQKKKALRKKDKTERISLTFSVIVFFFSHCCAAPVCVEEETCSEREGQKEERAEREGHETSHFLLHDPEKIKPWMQHCIRRNIFRLKRMSRPHPAKKLNMSRLRPDYHPGGPMSVAQDESISAAEIPDAVVVGKPQEMQKCVRNKESQNADR